MRIKYLVVLSVLATALLCSGGVAKIQAVDNSAQIAQLMAQIQALQAQLQTLQSQQDTTQAWCHTFSSNLGVGSTGSDVSALLVVLDKESILDNSAPKTVYDEIVAGAVVKFQAKYGIIQSGYVGALTRAKLNAMYGCKTQTVCTPKWTCGWGPCLANGTQWQVAIDSNNCGTTTGKIICPSTAQYCTQSIQPSIIITDPSGNKGITVNVGSTFTIQGSPSNLQGVAYYTGIGDPTSGYYNMAWFFNQQLVSCTNNNPATNNLWTMTCTATAAGVNTMHVEIYENGQMYSSNTATVTINPTSTQPSITITSPNGGSFPAASNVTVAWNRTGVIPANIFYFVYLKPKPDQVLGGTTTPITYTPLIFRSSSLTYPSFSITLPTDVNQIGGSPIIPGTYYLELDLADTNGVPFASSTSKAFTITSSNNTQSSITVTSPNGGESLIVGQPTTISWNTTGFSPSDNVYINLYDSSIYCAPGSVGCWTDFPISSVALKNTGSYTWNTNTHYGDGGPSNPLYLSQKVSPGAVYKIKISITNASTGATTSDSSDNYFSIVAPASLPAIAINSVSSPTTVIAGQQGRWDVNIATTLTGTLYYYVSSWGDGTSSLQYSTSPTYFHTYTAAGTYTATFNAFLGDSRASKTVTTVVAASATACTSGATMACNAGLGLGTQVCNSSGQWGNCVVAQTQQPSITVTSPNGGETWAVGSTHNITWTSAGSPAITYVWIALYKGGIFLRNINYPSNTGTYSWTVPDISAGSDYKIRIYNYSDSSTYDDSNASFSIMANAPATDITVSACTSWNYSDWTTCSASGTQTRIVTASLPSGCSGGNPVLSQSCTPAIQSSIAITSPNGGESWARGTTHNITWTSSGFSSAAKIAMNFGQIKTGGSILYNFATQYFTNTGSGQYTIPASAATGSYEIFLQASEANIETASDSSNTPFTVTVCTPKWACAWGTCVNGKSQWQAIDANSCGVTTGQITCPNLSQSCIPPPISFNLQQDSLASMAVAVLKLAAEIQAMLTK